MKELFEKVMGFLKLRTNCQECGKRMWSGESSFCGTECVFNWMHSLARLDAELEDKLKTRCKHCLQVMEPSADGYCSYRCFEKGKP